MQETALLELRQEGSALPSPLCVKGVTGEANYPQKTVAGGLIPYKNK